MNLFRPIQIAQEIWRNSDPNTVSVENIPLARPLNSALLGLWWAMWIISNIMANISSRMTWDATTPEAFRSATITSMIAEVTAIVAAMLALAVVSAIDARQVARAEVLRAQVAWSGEVGV